MLDDIFMNLKFRDYDDIICEIKNNVSEFEDYWNQLLVAFRDFNKSYERKKNKQVKVRPQNYAPKSQEGEYTLRVHNKYMVFEHNGKSVHTACAPEDKFDMVQGFELLLKRMEQENDKQP